MKLLGIGTAVPQASMTQDAAATAAAELCAVGSRQERLLHTLYRQTGIQKRHAVVAAGGSADDFYPPPTAEAPSGPATGQRMQVYARQAAVLALEASRKALDASGLQPAAITHLVTVSCSGFSAPGVDFHLVRELGLPLGTQRVHVGFMGCHGAINGLRVARALAQEPGAAVLLCCVELCSLHLQYGWDPNRLTANALFADGAAATILSSQGTGLRVAATGSQVIPDSEGEMTWEIGDHGFRMTLSPRVPDLIAGALPRWLPGWLESAGTSLEEIAAYAIHPGGPRIVTAVGQCLGLGEAALAPSRGVLRDYGNMSSPTVLFVLERLLADGCRGPIVMLAFGPGLTAEVALLGL